tara:strand:- start:1517 stop:2317 length:801 start_codon:yes stop_codon:yes gene_type:complete
VKNILSEICTKKFKQIESSRAAVSITTLRSEAEKIKKTCSFRDVLAKAVSNGNVGLIAEIKKASPSKGLIRKNFNPNYLAKQYAIGGASCLSVLTEENYFDGHIDHLKLALDAVSLPILRKDFIIDPYQVYETRAIGADCILLIMAALEDKLAADMASEARRLGMDILIEVHDEFELERVDGLEYDLIGINNRNLKTLEIDLATTERLAPLIPQDKDVICESGIYSNKDIERILRTKVSRFLVGESLMRQNNVALATQELLSIRNL